jgi:hypothetical protein
VITIADGIDLPDELVTEVTAILARRSAGKTYTAKKIAEQVIKLRLPVVIIDPLGAFWGLRSSLDGESAGLPVVIFGGAHADVALTVDAGKTIAEVVVDNPGAYIVDLSHFDTKGEEITFMTAFLERLYRYKAQHPSALLLIIDEADTFAPQKPETREIKMLGSMESIVRRGRLRGLGVILITQRAAVLNKNCLTQAEVLILLQTTSPQDRAAVLEWIKAKSAEDEQKEVMSTIGSLEKGEAWIWSPAWLKVLARVRILPQETFDSSKTPVPGEAIVEPSEWAQVDLEALGAKIAAAREKSEREDPEILRRRLDEALRSAAHFERELKTARETKVSSPVAIIAAGDIERLEKVVDEVKLAAGRVGVVLDQAETYQRRLEEIGESIGAQLEEWAPGRTGPHTATFGREMVALDVPHVPLLDRHQKTPSVATKHDWLPLEEPIALVTRVTETTNGIDVEAVQTSLGKAERAFLSVLAQFPAGRTKSQAAFLAGYSPNVSTTKNNLSRLRTRGYISGVGSEADPLMATDAGIAALGDNPEVVPTGRALAEWWMGRLGKADGAFFRAIVDAHPRQISRAEAAAAAGYDPSVSTTKNNLSKLRTLGLIVGMDPLGVSPDLGL